MPVGYRVGSNPIRIITLVIVLAATLFAQQTQAPAPCLARPAAERAYQQDRLLNMVRSNDPARASFLIRTCGVAAAFTPELEQALRAAGARDAVVQAVRAAAPAPPPSPPPKTEKAHAKKEPVKQDPPPPVAQRNSAPPPPPESASPLTNPLGISPWAATIAAMTMRSPLMMFISPRAFGSVRPRSRRGPIRG